jgi:hypothetical protein
MSPAAGWDTDLVALTGRRVQRGQTAARLILLAAVLAGLFGMHVLTAEDGNSRHGALPMISAAGPHGLTGHDPTPAHTMPAMDATGVVAGGGTVVAPTTSAPTDPAPGGDHGSMAGCILFLVLGGTALILLLLHHRNTTSITRPGRLPGPVLTEIRRRGPPVRWPRLALCVIRV